MTQEVKKLIPQFEIDFLNTLKYANNGHPASYYQNGLHLREISFNPHINMIDIYEGENHQTGFEDNHDFFHCFVPYPNWTQFIVQLSKERSSVLSSNGLALEVEGMINFNGEYVNRVHYSLYEGLVAAQISLDEENHFVGWNLRLNNARLVKSDTLCGKNRLTQNDISELLI